MLYVQIEKVLYGMLRAALLFYCKLRADLEDMGFEVNPYDVRKWLFCAFAYIPYIFR